MTILADWEINERFNPSHPLRYKHAHKGIIGPFVQEQVNTGISYGLTSRGYDIRLNPDDIAVIDFSVPFRFNVIKFWDHLKESKFNIKAVIKRCIERNILDVKNFDPGALKKLIVHEDSTGKFVIVPKHSYVLGVSKEYLEIPKNIIGIVSGKSTIARGGVVVNITPLEPGWCGYITLELANVSGVPVKVYVDEGIAQVMFHEGEEAASVYDSTRKYQDQPKKIVLPKVIKN